MNLIDIKSLRFSNLSYGVQNSSVFDEVTFDFPANETVVVLGKIGAGKSTLLKIMSGLVLPTGGEYLINEQNVGGMSFGEMLPFRLRIGYSFDMGGLLNNKTLFENISLPLEYHALVPPDQIFEKVNALLDWFEILNFSKSRPSEVSGGIRKAAIVARAFVLNPELLLLDDPTTGLTQSNYKNLVTLIQKCQSNGVIKHIYCASEDKRFIDQVATKILVLEKNKMTLLDNSPGRVVNEN